MRVLALLQSPLPTIRDFVEVYGQGFDQAATVLQRMPEFLNITTDTASDVAGQALADLHKVFQVTPDFKKILSADMIPICEAIFELIDASESADLCRKLSKKNILKEISPLNSFLLTNLTITKAVETRSFSRQTCF